MNRFIKKYQRQLMAFFGVFLMVTFLVQLGPKSGDESRRKDRVTGTIAGDKIYAADVENARHEWGVLRETISKEIYMASGGRASSIAMKLGQVAVQQISARPEMFLLLQKEATKMGVVVNDDALNAVMKNDVVLKDNSYETTQEVRTAVSKLLLVLGGFDRALDNIKISRPLAEQRMAVLGQEMKVNVVELPASEFESRVTPPTDAELKTQFDRFVNDEPERPTRDNPFGFGYKYPDRVKMQYISVRFEALKNAVRARHTEPYYWETEALKLYKKNPQLFATTNPSTQPTTRPFTDVREDAMSKAMEPEIASLLNEVRGKIAAAMSTDWTKYQRANPTTASVTPVSTSLGASYETFDYLHALAAEIQKQTSVLPDITEINDYKGRLELNKLQGIGKSGTSLSVGALDFGGYATLLCEPLAGKQAKELPDLLKTYQPSQWLFDQDRNAYMFRITSARAAEKPTDYKQVEAQVRADLRKSSTYALAHRAGEELLVDIKNTPLAQSAKAANRAVFSTDYFGATSSEIKGYTVDKESVSTFVGECFRLVNDPIRRNHAKPAHVFDLPKEQKTLVIEVADLRSDWSAEVQDRVLASYRTSILRDFQKSMLDTWFVWEGVVDRLRYQPSDTRSNTEG